MKNTQKIFAIIIALILLLPCFMACTSGSTTSYEAVDKEEERKKAFPIELIYISCNGNFDFYYDRDTKVIYVTYCMNTYDGDGCAMTPLYNADGTLRTYEAED